MFAHDMHLLRVRGRELQEERCEQRHRLARRRQRLLAPAELLKRQPRLLSDLARSGRKASGRSAARRAANLDRLVRRYERILAPAEVAQAIAKIVERSSETGQEGVGPCGGEAATNLDRLVCRRERVLAPAESRRSDCRD